MNDCDEKIGGSPFAIGDIALNGRAILAPMSGVTDIGMRRAAMAFGASMVVSEMVASDEFVNGRQEARLRAQGQGVYPHTVQIAGCEPQLMAEAARLAEASGADIIDINMGCPAKRVNGRMSGSALMREPDNAIRLVEATVAAVKVPVTVKMRLGWDRSSLNAPELARSAEVAGAQLITVHGRTRCEFYKGQADWAAIRAVKDAINIPLVANGDCRNGADARQMLARSGADAVMIGRAAVGQPWLAGEIAAALAGLEPQPIHAAGRREAALAHLESLLETMGIQAGIRHARKHLSAYAAFGGGLDNEGRLKLVTSENAHEVRTLLASAFDMDRRKLAA